jgi:esterase/lipase
MRAKILIIHGLNNNMEAFLPLKAKLDSLGYETSLLCLPGHADNRDETRDFQNAMEIFDQKMSEHTTPFSVIAFSQGALYLQLWLEKNPSLLPKAQLLLAPALFIRHFSKLDWLISGLPSFAFIISQMPKKLRRYSYLHIWEYRTLFNKAKQFQKKISQFKIPTLILVDPKDELVDSQKLKATLEEKNTGAEVLFFERDYLKGKRPGKYHILFHPDYFSPDDWEFLVNQIDQFFKKIASSSEV